MTDTFDAVIERSTFLEAMEIIERVTDETRVVLGQNALKTRMVDEANVAMAEVEIPESEFETYTSSIDAFGINVERITDVLGNLEGETVTLSMSDEFRRLHLEGDDMKYRIAVIDPQSIHRDPDSPDLDLGTTLEMPGEELRRMTEAFDVIEDGEPIEFEVGASFMFRLEGDDDKAEYTPEEAELTGDDQFTNMYSFDYVEPISVQVRNRDLTLHLGEDMPFLLDFGFGGGAANARYMLAPRIDESD